MGDEDALVIVAHPDDETIWMGGTIARNRGWNWTIISLCRASDQDRKPKFERVCRIYGARGIILDLNDENLLPIGEKKIIETIERSLPKKEYAFVFTHGENGEYGHIRHLETHGAVKKMLKEKDLKAGKVYYFDYEKGKNVPYPELVPPKPIESADLVIKLSEKELELKRQIVRDVYGYPNEKGFELMSCNKIESFKIGK